MADIQTSDLQTQLQQQDAEIAKLKQELEIRKQLREKDLERQKLIDELDQFKTAKPKTDTWASKTAAAVEITAPAEKSAPAIAKKIAPITDKNVCRFGNKCVEDCGRYHPGEHPNVCKYGQFCSNETCNRAHPAKCNTKCSGFHEQKVCDIPRCCYKH